MRDENAPFAPVAGSPPIDVPSGIGPELVSGSLAADAALIELREIVVRRKRKAELGSSADVGAATLAGRLFARGEAAALRELLQDIDRIAHQGLPAASDELCGGAPEATE